MKKIIFFVLLALNISYAVEWERLNFKTVSSITSIVLNTQNDIYISTLNNGAFYSSDSGETWVEIDSTSQYQIYDIAFNSTGQSFFTSDERLIITTESKIDTIIEGFFGPEIVIDSNDNIFINTRTGIIHSYDNGVTWALDSTFYIHETYKLNIDNDNNLYVSLKSGLGTEIESGLFKSIDQGVTWQYLSFYMDSHVKTAFPTDNNVYALSNYKLYISDDSGNSWNSINEQVPRTFEDLEVDNNDQLYALPFNGGIYRYNKQDSIWMHIIDTGITDSLITCLAFDSSNVAFVGTENGYIFKNASPTTSLSSFKDNILHRYYLKQNYPNPFNSITVIRYNLLQSNNVKLIVYNMHGQKVKTLVNYYQTPGKYNVKWYGKDEAGNIVSSGFYFYQITVDKVRFYRKMLLLK